MQWASGSTMTRNGLHDLTTYSIGWLLSHDLRCVRLILKGCELSLQWLYKLIKNIKQSDLKRTCRCEHDLPRTWAAAEMRFCRLHVHFLQLKVKSNELLKSFLFWCQMFKLMESHTFLQQCLHLPIGCCGLSSVTVFEYVSSPESDRSICLLLCPCPLPVSPAVKRSTDGFIRAPAAGRVPEDRSGPTWQKWLFRRRRDDGDGGRAGWASVIIWLTRTSCVWDSVNAHVKSCNAHAK